MSATALFGCASRSPSRLLSFSNNAPKSVVSPSSVPTAKPVQPESASDATTARQSESPATGTWQVTSNAVGEAVSPQPAETAREGFAAASVVESLAMDQVATAAVSLPPIADAQVVTGLPNAATTADVELVTTKPASPANPPLARSVRLVIDGVRPKFGAVKVAIYTQAAAFPDPSGALQTFELEATQATIETTIRMDVPFAVGVFQDLNDDGELNRSRLGIPLEPFAFSNNAMGRRSAPSFDQAVVAWPAATATLPSTDFAVAIHLP